MNQTLSWNSISFPILSINSGYVPPNKKNNVSLKLMSFLAFINGLHTNNQLKQYSDSFIQHIQGLVLITNIKKSNNIFGYCFKAKHITSHSAFQNVVFYDMKDTSLSQQFLNYCQTLFYEEYNGQVQFMDNYPKDLSSSSSLSSTLNIGNNRVSHITSPRTPQQQMNDCIVHARARYGLVFKPFTHDQESETYIALCLGTPMGRELGRIPYTIGNMSVGKVESKEQEVVPPLLECFATNLVGKMYTGDLPTARSINLPDEPEPHILFLDFSLIYEPILAGHGIEMPHSIHIYPTQGFSIGDEHLVIDTSILDPHVDALDIDIQYNFSVSKAFIPDNASLNIDVYATYINDCGQQCINQAGFASLKFSDFFTGEKIKADLIVPASSNPTSFSKGVVELKLKQSNMKIKSREHTHPIESLASKQHLIYGYIERNREFYNAHPTPISSIQHVTVFGFQTRTLYIPGSLFDVFNIPKTKEDYFVNALLLSYHRRLILEHPETTPSYDLQLLADSWVNNTSQQEKICVVMDMLAMFVNYCTYQTDEVDHNVSTTERWRESKVEKMDSFDDIMARLNGDCEDFSMEILREVMTLKYNNAEYTNELIVQYVIPILYKFIFVSGLAGVTSDSINGAKSGKETSIGGHECVYAIPNYIFFKAFSRNKENKRALDQLFEFDERMAGHETHEQIYIIEGTGNLFPEPRSKTHRWSMMEDQIFDCDTEDHLNSKVLTDYFFYNPDAEDNFYKMIITLLTPEFYFRFGVPIFEFLVVKEGEYLSEKIYMRGVSFQELLHIDDHPTISIVACPEIPSQVLKYSLAIHENDFPPSPLIKPTPSQDILDIAKSIKYIAPSSSSCSSQNNKQSFSFQIRFKDMKQEIIDELLFIAKKTNFSLRCDAEFIHHPSLYPNLICGGYNISFY